MRMPCIHPCISEMMARSKNEHVHACKRRRVVLPYHFSIDRLKDRVSLVPNLSSDGPVGDLLNSKIPDHTH